MKQIKLFLKKAVVFLFIVVFAVLLCVNAYDKVLSILVEECCDTLNIAASNMSRQIGMRFTDHINMLTYVSDALALKGEEALATKETLEYLESVQESPGTFYERFDIIFADGTQLCQDGHRHPFIGVDTFEQMVSRGSHISPRTVDDHTKDYVLYVGAPIVINGENVAMIMGMINCDTLSKEFVSRVYGEETQVFLVDCQDGAYLIDEWHGELGNVKDLGERDFLEGYPNVNIAQEMLAGETGLTGFVSRTSGKNAYQAYTYIPELNWSVAIMTHEEQVFESVDQLRSALFLTMVVGIVLLFLYFAWNVMMILRNIKNEEKIKNAEMEKHRNEAKTVFLSSISHDIRTPLNGILGMLSVIKYHENVPEKTQVALKKIETSARYLETLANDVLDLNELENGKITLNDDIIDLHAFAEKIASIVQENAINKGVSYTVNHENIQNSRVHCSLIHLQRIMVNLSTNAIKYNHINGNVEFTVEELSQKDGKGVYRFIVKDDGQGISEEFQKTMFNSFEQENSGARSENKGHGLGLAIVKRLVDKMKGTIEVESQKDVGSTFTVTLTLAQDLSLNGKTVDDEEDIIYDISGTRILLVEDNELNMEIATSLLEEAGAEIVPAVNGKEAVEIFSENPPESFDIILMDIMMPEMNGLEATIAIRELPRDDAKDICIIAMTAGTFADDIRRCFDAGMNGHLGKPIDMEEVTRKICESKGKNFDILRL